MLNNVIITDGDNANKGFISLIHDDFEAYKVITSTLKTCMNLPTYADLYLPVNILFNMNAPLIKYIVTNNIKLVYDKDIYETGHSFSNNLFEKMQSINEYSNSTLGGYKFIYKHHKVDMQHNNKLFMVTINVEDISKYINDDTVHKHDTYIVNQIKALKRGDYLYRSALLQYIGDFSVDWLLENNILTMDGKRYYLTNA